MNTQTWISLRAAKPCSDSSMVDEYDALASSSNNCLKSSDSSMVDEYPGICQPGRKVYAFRFLYGRWILNRPETGWSRELFRFLYGRWIPISFSSIDFSGCVQIPLWSMNTVLSKRYVFQVITFRFLYGRWIPWYISCIFRAISGFRFLYMVDEYENIVGVAPEYPAFRFLYGRWIPKPYSTKIHKNRVQIPLWSMNTLRVRAIELIVKSFRFLYGRWIRAAWSGLFFFCISSDSSMVDEYRN